MKRRTIGSVVVVFLALLIKRVLEPEKEHIVERDLNGRYTVHSVDPSIFDGVEFYAVDPSALESFETVRIGELELDDDDVVEVCEYDPDENTAYVSPDDLQREGDSS